MEVDPWGEVIGELGTGEDILVADIDLDRREHLRKTMPFHLQQRLPGL